MADKPHPRKQLEAAIGRELDPSVAPFWKEFQWLAATFVDIDQDDVRSLATYRSILPEVPRYCDFIRIIDAAGAGMTGSDGKSVFRLSQYVCEADVVYTSTNVVATPLTQGPFFLTVERAVVDNGADVEITVSTWAPNGAVAPDVMFDWRCRVTINPIMY